MRTLLGLCRVQALHDHRPAPIVHSDLKSMNILLFDAGDGSAVAKVGRS